MAICFVQLATAATAQQLPRRQWDRVLGGDGLENFKSVQPTTDGGYILGGTSGSGVSGDKTQPTKGAPSEPSTNYDYWLVKLDAAGNKQWDRAYGGNDTDALAAVQQTTDGGYIMGGYSVSPASGDRSAPAKHGYWVVKVDAQGVKQWDKSFSNQSLPSLNALQQTADGGYILGGYSLGDLPGTPGRDDQSGPYQGGHDFWVIKLDAAGNKQWDRALGGTEFDFLHDVRQTADGGYLVGGTSTSGISGDKTEASRGGNDYWVVKLDARGATQWDRTYGGAGPDALYSLCQTLDGGYILAGQSGSGISGDKTQAQRGGGDYWILKVDAQGRKLWDRSFGGSGQDQPNSVWPCPDGGFLVAGQSDSGISGDKSKAGFGLADYWLVKLNAAGTKDWDEVYGGSNLDFLQGARPTPDGGFILGGTSYSGASCGKTQDTWGSADYWIIKLGTAANSPLGTIIGDTLLCGTSPSLLRLKTVVTASSYQWSTGATTASIPVTQPGLYSVSATLCDGTVAAAQIRVGQVTAAVRGPASFCAGSTAALLADAPGATGFSWNTGQRTAAITVAQAGTYTVTATFPGGCSLVSSHTVGVPQVTLSGDSLLCEGRPQQLTAATTDGVASYRWSTGATTASIAVAQPGRYSVTATHANGCTSTATQTVGLIPRLSPPPPSTDTTVCETAELVLRAPVAHDTRATYRWSDNSTDSTLRVTQPGLYTLQVTNPCQTVAVSWRVTYRSCVFIPNIVTANNDGVNDRFVINNLPAGAWDLQVVNRWGAQVYHAAHYRNDWGLEAITGVYYYVLRNTKSTEIYRGWVQVVR
ncbi:gliding motility-associated C-terminal domain-containing protein [Hymenobacter lapidiphilus]|uniref:Gliding motility-associated C-terminal domain-containing protein n=1 Tax=Hymenobacter lapidiphilus TaxID=2608003 RepID=A0A7Y7PQB0_9BACT|nr:gliding motility-associated C-terminal domain-containing protein [Hymenobacter lapidiphilus]NVO31787.1 gliding motility-associated C-terminal domain-containing protein [Hymenobacter lapidiphilus]